MLGINSIRLVTAATKASAAKGSRASWPPALSQRWVGAGWSVKPMASKPALSAVLSEPDQALFGQEFGVVGVTDQTDK